MIRITGWKSKACSSIDLGKLRKQYDVAFVGIRTIDDRTNWVSEYVDKVAERALETRFEYETSLLHIDIESHSIRDLNFSIVKPDSRVLIDATSLTFPEILYLFTNLDLNKVNFEVLYIQPDEYDQGNKEKEGEIEPVRLSLDGHGPKSLPPYVQTSKNASILVFLGFEGHRLGSISNSDIFGMDEYTCLIGIPGFKAGWENKAVYNNMSYISDLGIKEILISGANDPVFTYKVIEKQYKAAFYEKKKLFLAPFGTKPAGIAAANFAVNTKSNLGLIYDFIQNKVGRSNGTGIALKWVFTYENQ